MKQLLPLVPSFLRKIDLYLLQRYPILWETKIVYVLFYSGIVANLALISVGFALPISRTYLPDYGYLTATSMLWTSILVILALAYYAYQQSTVRIPIYSLRQNIVRLGLYLVAISCLLTNLVALPYTAIWRVKQLYSQEQLAQDHKQIIKTQFLKDFINHFEKVYTWKEQIYSPLSFAEEKNQETLDYKLRKGILKSHFGRKNELQDILKAKADLKKIEVVEYREKKLRIKWDLEKESSKEEADYSFLLPEVHKVRQAVTQYCAGKAFQRQVQDNITTENVLEVHRPFMRDLNYELATKAVQEVLSRYPEDKKVEITSRHIYQRVKTIHHHKPDETQDLYASFYNVREYFRANIFLQTSQYEPSNNLLLNIMELDKIYDKSDVFSGEDVFLKFIQSFYSQDEAVKGEDIKGETDKDKESVLTCLQKFTNEAQFEKVVNPVVYDFTPHHLRLGYTWLPALLFFALFILVSKSLSFSRLFIGFLGVLGTIGLGALGVYVSLTYFPWLKAYLFLGSYEMIQSNQSDFGRVLSDTSYVIGLFTLLSSLVAGFAYWKKLHKQWLGAVFVYCLLFYFTIFGFLAIMAQQTRVSQVYFSSRTEDFTIYLLMNSFLAIFVFVLYSIYNYLLKFPLKR